MTNVFTPDFNLCEQVRLFTTHDAPDAYALARDLLPSRTHDELYWHSAALSVATALILHICYRAQSESRPATLLELRSSVDPAHVLTTLQTAAYFPHDPEYRNGWRTVGDSPTPTHPLVYTLLRHHAEKPGSERAAVLAHLNSVLSPDPAVLSRCEGIRLANLRNQERFKSLRPRRSRRATSSTPSKSQEGTA